jgi:transglutaminase-like putative cysteine protease
MAWFKNNPTSKGTFMVNICPHRLAAAGAFVLSAFLLAATAFSASTLQESALKILPQAYREKVGEVLSTAGANGDSLAQAVLELTAQDEIEAAAFLLANLSRVDRVTLRKTTLLDNVRLAVQARKELPWGQDLTDELFLAYVLPHRTAQEPIEDWRRPVYEELKQRVSGCSTATQAALEINRWCHESVTYQPTSWRDLGPLTTRKSGLGRCEEEMIFYICAARSVAIPARSCFTPLWGFQDDNHAWVEVWVDGDWHYLGACEPAETLDKAWFSSAVRRAALVLSTGYGAFSEGTENPEPVYRQGDNYAYVNSTGVYTDTVALTFQLTLPDGSPPDSMDIWASVFSYGGLRGLARIPTDSMGVGKCVFGVTDMIISAGNDSLGVFRILRVRPERPRMVSLKLSEVFSPSPEFWLHHPQKELPEQEATEKSEVDSLNTVITKLEGKLRDAGRKEVELNNRAMNPELADLSDHFDPRWTQVATALNDARGNWSELADVVEQTDSAYMDDLLWLLDDMSQKDRWEISAQALIEHFEVGEMGRNLYQESIPDSIYRQYVLGIIIDREPPLPWRKALQQELEDIREKSLENTVEKLNQWITDNVKEINERTPFAHRATPIEVLRMGGGDKRDLAVFAVGCLRALGIPGRMAMGDRWAEWFNGTEFLPIYPLEPDRLGDTSKDAETEKIYRREGVVALTFVQQDTVTTKPKFEKQFTLSQWQDGFYSPDEREGSYQDSSYYLSVEAGDWLLTYGIRKEKEATYIQAIPVTVIADDTVRLNLSVDLPEE